MIHLRTTKGVDYTYSELTRNPRDYDGFRTESHASEKADYASIVSSRKTRPHWYGPTWMTMSYVLGIMFAALHHFYNLFWNGRRVDDLQTWVNRGGLALAFSTKTCFGITCTAAYVQQQFLTMHTHPFLLPEIDIMFSVLRDAKKLAYFHLWWKHPILLILAIFSWLAGLVVVFSATLISTAIEHAKYTGLSQVPQLDLGRHSIARTYENDTSIDVDYPYIMHASAVQTAVAGDYPPLPYPANAVNATYELNMTVPYVKCRDISSSPAATAFQTLNQDQKSGRWTYYSYVPSDSIWASFNATKIANSSLYDWNTWDQSRNGSSTLNFFFRGTPYSGSPRFYYVSCELWNATQTVLFNFTYPVQNYKIVKGPDLSTAVGAGDLVKYEAQSSAWNDTVGHLSAMQMLGLVFAGGTRLTEHNATEPYQTLRRLTRISWRNSSTAIQGIQDVFTKMSIGYLASDRLTQNISVPVTVRRDLLVFDYKPMQLLKIYGIFAGFSLVALCVGLQAIYRNSANYTDSFSTIMRAFGGTTTDQGLWEADDGADPLPERLRQAELSLRPQSKRQLDGYS